MNMNMKQLSKEITIIATIGILCTSALTCKAFSTPAPWMKGGSDIEPSSWSSTASTTPQNSWSTDPENIRPEQREEIVRKYFDGVNKKDRLQIQSCFASEACITDICSINASKRMVKSDVLAERCMEFLAAHPDCKVDFHYPPTCGRNNNWVFAHWYETGTWSGDSKGIKATNNPMAVEGQTRFYVNDELKITEFVVTRTFTEWETVLQSQNKAPVNQVPQTEVQPQQVQPAQQQQVQQPVQQVQPAQQQQVQQPAQQQQAQQPVQQVQQPVQHAQQLVQQAQQPPQQPYRVQSQQSVEKSPRTTGLNQPRVGTRPSPNANKKQLAWTTPGTQPGAGHLRSNNGKRAMNTQKNGLSTDGDSLAYTSRGEKQRKKGAGLTWSK